MNFRIGKFAVSLAWYPVGIGWRIRNWSWKGETSWKHGTANLGRIKIIW